MNRQIDLISFIRNDSGKSLQTTEFETAAASAIEMTPTRAGQVMHQSLLESNQGHYLWIIASDTLAGGAWLATHIQSGLDALKETANIYQHSVYTLHHARTGEHISASAGVGSAGSVLRIIDLESDEQVTADELKQATDLIKIHPANRIGHSTDAMALLEQPEGIIPSQEKRFKLLIAHQRDESFRHKDTFTKDISAALTEVTGLAVISGFNEYQILLSIASPA